MVCPTRAERLTPHLGRPARLGAARSESRLSAAIRLSIVTDQSPDLSGAISRPAKLAPHQLATTTSSTGFLSRKLLSPHLLSDLPLSTPPSFYRSTLQDQPIMSIGEVNSPTTLSVCKNAQQLHPLSTPLGEPGKEVGQIDDVFSTHWEKEKPISCGFFTVKAGTPFTYTCVLFLLSLAVAVLISLYENQIWVRRAQARCGRDPDPRG